jgi:choline dehydrogenase-like flavoprotein
MSAAAFAQVISTPAAQSSRSVLRRLRDGRRLDASRPSGGELARVIRDAPSFVLSVKGRYVEHQHHWPADLEHAFCVWIEQLPERSNRIGLSDRVDRFGMPLAKVHWRPIASDEATFRATVRRLRSYWERHRLDRVCRLRWTAEASDAELSIADGAGEIYHPSGTTPMGRDDRTAVVSPDELRCHRVVNLRVVSASVYPTAGSTGPTCTLLQLAMRAADQLAAGTE